MTEDKENKVIEVKVTAVFDKDTRNYHRYSVVEEVEAGITGNLYLNREIDPFPKRILIELKSK